MVEGDSYTGLALVIAGILDRYPKCPREKDILDLLLMISESKASSAPKSASRV